jgi:serine carboxypeptidase-like clade 1
VLRGGDSPPPNRSAALDEMDLRLRDLNIYDTLAECYHPKSHDQVSMRPGHLSADFFLLEVSDTMCLLSNQIHVGFSPQARTPDLPLPVRSLGRAWPLRAPVKMGAVPTWAAVMSENLATRGPTLV